MNYLQRVAAAGARTAVPYRAPVGVRLFGTEASGALDAEQRAGASYDDADTASAPASPSAVAASGVAQPDPDRPTRDLVPGDTAHVRTATPFARAQVQPAPGAPAHSETATVYAAGETAQSSPSPGAPAPPIPGVPAPPSPGAPASHPARAANAAPAVTVRVPRGFADPPPVVRSGAPAPASGAPIPGATALAATPSAARASSSRASSREASSSASAVSDAATHGVSQSPPDADTVPARSLSHSSAAASFDPPAGVSPQAASSAAFAQHLAEHAAATARPSLPRDGTDADTPSPNRSETGTVLDSAARVAVPLDREASATIRAGAAPRTSVTIGTVDVHVAPPPKPVAPPPREPPRAATPRRSAIETRFLDRFLLGG